MDEDRQIHGKLHPVVLVSRSALRHCVFDIHHFAPRPSTTRLDQRFRTIVRRQTTLDMSSSHSIMEGAAPQGGLGGWRPGAPTRPRTGAAKGSSRTFAARPISAA